MRTLKITLLLSVLFGLQAQAQIRIQLSKSADNAIPFAVVPFAGSSDMASIIAADLNRSGRFKTILQVPEQVSQISQINPANWQASNITYAAVGSVNNGQVNFELGNVTNKQKLEGRGFKGSDPAQQRRIAHQISDIIFEKMTGLPGAFDSRVAYITTSGRNYALVVADADGANPRVILNSNEPIFSPAWSPDASKIAYSTLEGKRSRLVIQDLYSGNRRVISEEAGINSAPSWSPDGSRLVLTLSKDGNPEIYTISASSGGLTRLTNNASIDTEPKWAQDGNIYFTSDRGGQPQIYRMSAGGGEPERVTFKGNYNAHASISPDGKYLATMNRGEGAGFGIAVTDLSNQTTKRLTNGGRDESPSFSSNGQMIIYSTGNGLAAISADGTVKQSVSGSHQNVRDPAWSPKLRN